MDNNTTEPSNIRNGSSFTEFLKSFKASITSSIGSLVETIKDLRKEADRANRDNTTPVTPIENSNNNNNVIDMEGNANSNKSSDSDNKEDDNIAEDIVDGLEESTTEVTQTLSLGFDSSVQRLENIDGAISTLDNNLNDTLANNHSNLVEVLTSSVSSLIEAVSHTSTELGPVRQNRQNDNIIDVDAREVHDQLRIEGPANTAANFATQTTTEDKVESARKIDKIIDLLTIIAENTAGHGKGGGERPQQGQDNDGGIGQLGMLSTILAAGIGALIGTVKAYINSVKIISSGIGGLLKSLGKVFPVIEEVMLTFEKVVGGIKSIAGTITTVLSAGVELAKKSIMSALTPVIEFGATIFDKIKSVFGVVEELAKPVINAVKTIVELSAPVAESIGFVSELFNGIKSFFTGLVESVSKFAKLAKSFAVVFEAILTPIFVIMTLYDVVKAMMKGYDEEGIIGAVKGALKGLLSSIITVPLDLVKGLISWIVGALGFKKLEEALDSFSFEDIGDWVIDSLTTVIKSMLTLFSPIGKIIAVIANLGDLVNDMVKGWEEDGLVGALKNGLMGLLDILVFAPLEAIKGIVAQIAGFFGFDNVKEALDNFSIKDSAIELFKNLIFEPLEKLFSHIGDIFKQIKDDLLSFVEDFGIPEIKFHIPIIDKDITIGPFYPFKNNTQNKVESDGTKTDNVAKNTELPTKTNNLALSNNEEILPNPEPKLTADNVAHNIELPTKTDNLALSDNEELVQPDILKPEKLNKDDLLNPETLNNSSDLYTLTTPSDLDRNNKMSNLSNNIVNNSANNEDLRQTPINNSGGGPSINYAPVTSVNNSTNNYIRIPSRNTDNSILEYFRSRYFSGCRG